MPIASDGFRNILVAESQKSIVELSRFQLVEDFIALVFILIGSRRFSDVVIHKHA